MSDCDNRSYCDGVSRGYEMASEQFQSRRSSQSQYDFDRGYSRGRLDSFDEFYGRGFEAGKLAGIYEEKSNNLKKDKNEQIKSRIGYRRYIARFLVSVFTKVWLPKGR